jgi:branched-chain amino acid transport system substrate-binding protein
MGRSRFLQLAGRSAEGARFPLLFVPNPTDPATARFLEQFAREHHYPPDYTAALTYDATRLLIEAIRRAGPNRARIREAIVHLSPWTGIAGTIRWDGTGQNTRTNVQMATLRAGRIVLSQCPLAARGSED